MAWHAGSSKLALRVFQTLRQPEEEAGVAGRLRRVGAALGAASVVLVC